MNRQFRSQNILSLSTEWALRLASVINMDEGKFPTLLQPKIFELCEQLVTQISITIEPFIGALISANHR